MLSRLLSSDPALTEPHRLAILCTIAAAREGATRFVPLRDALGLTDGNLNRHLATLERAGLIARLRTKEPGRHPQTLVMLTPGARERLREFAHVLVGAGETALRAAAVERRQERRNGAPPAEVRAVVAPTESVTLGGEEPVQAGERALVEERFAGPD